LEHLKDIKYLQVNITEWMPSSFTIAYHWPYIITLIFVLCIFAWGFLKNRNIPYTHILSLLYFALASSEHTRHIPFFSIISVSFLISILSKKDKYCLFIVIFGLSAVYIKSFIWPLYSRNVFMPIYASENSVQFLRNHHEQLKELKIYNPWHWGGYLGYKLIPDYKIFQDGRYLFHEYLKESDGIETDPEKWDSFAKKYDFGLVIFERLKYKFESRVRFKNGQTFPLIRPFYLMFFKRQEWALVYWDRKTLIFVRRNLVDKNWIDKHEFKILMPDDLEYVRIAFLNGEISYEEIKKESITLIRNERYKDIYNEGPFILSWIKKGSESFSKRNDLYGPILQMNKK
ncbi:MAG: hypothetical protein AB1633_12480, partial [Elusimicrobiota bacterium]